MPCTYGGPDYGMSAAEKAEVDVTTRAACEAMKELELRGLHKSVSPESQLWWEKHKQRDREREEIEKEQQAEKDLVREALGKLTPKELKALGLKRPI